MEENPEAVPVEFTMAELWMLHDFVRHDGEAVNRKRWPTVSTELNEAVALAVWACEDSVLDKYTLLLTYGDILLLDHHVRRDQKTPEGAKGKTILLKLFKARAELSYGPVTDDGDDKTYREATKEASDADTGPDTDDDADTNASTV